jgi:hypothetical protein
MKLKIFYSRRLNHGSEQVQYSSYLLMSEAPFGLGIVDKSALLPGKPTWVAGGAI